MSNRITDENGRLLAAGSQRNRTTNTEGRLSSISEDLSGVGWGIPAGSLDRLSAAKAGMGSSLLELLALGNSTVFGQSSGTPAPWPQYLRYSLIADGWPDGGRGIINGRTAAYSGEENLAGVLSSDASGNTAYNFPILLGEVSSDTLNEATVFQGHCTRFRVWNAALGTVTSAIAVSIDGGSEQILEPVIGYNNVYELSGLSAGLHQLTVRNVAGRTINAPTADNLNGPGLYNASPGLPIGVERRYKVTVKTAAGESLPSPAFVATPANSSNDGVSLGTHSYTAYGNFRLYVSTDAGVTYNLLVDDLPPLGNGNFYFEDDGSNSVDAGTHPPVTNTAGYAGPTECVYIAEALNNNGLVIHNHGIAGIALQNYLTGSAWPSGNLDANADPRTRAMFGLDRDSSVQPAWEASPDQASASRTIAGVLIDGGINDMQGQLSIPYFEGSLHIACRASRAAGADPIILKPALEAASHPELRSSYLKALNRVIASEGCAWVDLGSGGALGPVEDWVSLWGQAINGDPHLTHAAYTQQAAFIKENIMDRL